MPNPLTLLLDCCEHCRRPVWVVLGVNVVQERHQPLNRAQPRLEGLQRCVLSSGSFLKKKIFQSQHIDDMNETSFTVQNCALRINPTQNGGHTRPHATTAPGHQLLVHPSCPTETWQRIALQHTPRWNTISASTPVPSIAGSLAAPSWHGLSPTVPRKTLLQRTTCLQPPTPRQQAVLWPLRPSVSGYVLSLRFLAWNNATASVSAAPLLGSPSPRTLDTNVVSSASCTPPCKGSPVHNNL